MIPQKIIRLRGDWYDNLLGDYLSPKYDKLRTIFREKRHSIAQTSTTYRIINHWSEIGLINKNTQQGSGWRKFSLIDLIWIYILKDLREYGMPLEALKHTKESLFHLGKKENTVHFELFLSLAFLKKKVLLVVASDGEAGVMLEEEYNGQYQPDLPRTHLVLDLNDILAAILKKPDLKYSNELTLTLDSKESALLNKIRFEDNIREVNLKVNNNKIGKVNYKANLENPEHLTSILADLQKQKDKDRDITIKQKDGKFVLLEIVEKE